MIILDASFAFEVLVKTSLGERCLKRVASETAHAPHLIDIEIASGLRRLVAAGGLSPDIALEALEDLRSAAIERHEHTELLARIWELRNSVSAYDAAYIALAEALDAPLMTCDSKLSRSHGHRAKIVLAE